MSAALAAAVLLAVSPGIAAAVGGRSDYVFVVDCSGSMERNGRGEATVAALMDFVDGMEAGDRIAVYGYGESPFAVLADQPIVIDGAVTKKRIKASLNLPFAADRTDMTRGMEMAWGEWARILDGDAAQGGRHQRNACVVLLTDGKLIPVYQDYSMYDQTYAASRSRLIELSGLFGGKGIPVYTIGLGSSNAIDAGLMKRIAEKSGGRYYASSTSDRLAGVFEDLSREIRSQRMAENPAPESKGAESAAESVAPSADDEATSESFWTETAAGAPAEQDSETGTASRSLGSGALGLLASSAPEATAGILGIVLGFVALGIHRRQNWANAFTRPLLGHQLRVRGYMRPWQPKGSATARACIPIENLGLPLVEIGPGHEYGTGFKEAVIEFVGTADGTPPTLRVIKGDVKVDGQTVDKAVQLKDGTFIEIEGQMYTYQRGSRR